MVSAWKTLFAALTLSLGVSGALWLRGLCESLGQLTSQNIIQIHINELVNEVSQNLVYHG